MRGIENTSKKLVLDPCCGGRMFWFDKQNPDVLFCDNREFHGTLCDGRKFDVYPDVICDFTALPFKSESFYHVVFDPPHLLHRSTEKPIPTGYQMIKYGALHSDWKDVLTEGFSECFRVLKPYGTLVFKWNETDIKVKDVLALTSVTPLYGHRSGKASKTHWICFMKTPESRFKWLDELPEVSE